MKNILQGQITINILASNGGNPFFGKKKVVTVALSLNTSFTLYTRWVNVHNIIELFAQEYKTLLLKQSHLKVLRLNFDRINHQDIYYFHE